MDNRIFDLMMSCLSSILFDERAAERLDESYTKEELVAVYKLSKQHDVSHLVGIALSKAGLLVNTPELAARFEKEQYMAVSRYENFKYETDRIQGTFDKEKIPYVLLKGATIRDLYPQAWMRTSCDVDILVKEEDVDRAVSSLTKDLGYTTEGKKNFHDIDLFSGGGVHLELHFSIKEQVDSLDAVLDRVWDNLKKADDTSEMLVMSGEFLMYHIIAHTAYHFMGGGCGVRSLVDLYLLKNKLEYNEEQLRELCRESGIEKFYLSLCKLCECWFEGSEHIVLTDEMQKFILQGGAYGTKEAHIAARQESRGGKRGYAMSRIFAPYDVLKQRYPKMRGRAMTPIYQVRRWVDVARDGGVKRSVRELETINSLDIESVKTVQTLMKQLELDKHIK
ncbi:MAG: hypothetical protein E7592_00415 [Ruminococcaceae bacterium]|nr:hypothetical protein [Oscillospiraceae bacterium]